MIRLSGARWACAAWLVACAPPVTSTVSTSERPPVVDAAPSEVTAEDAPVLAELTKHARAITGAFESRAPRLADQGRVLVFRSTRDGDPHLYTSDALRPRAAVQRLDAGAGALHPFELVRPSPGAREQIVALGTLGGVDGVHAIDLDGAARTLTPSAKSVQFARIFATPLDPGRFVVHAVARSAEGGMARHGERSAAGGMVRHDERSTAGGMAQQLLGGTLQGAGELRVLYSDPRPFELCDVNRAGTSALIVRRDESVEELLVVDLQRQRARVVHKSGQIRLARWISGDDRRALVATDGSAEANLVLGLDAQSGRELWRYVDRVQGGTVRDAAVAPDGTQAALLVDTGGRHLLRFLDITEPPAVPKSVQEKRVLRDAVMPPGEGKLAGYTSDGARLLLDWARPEQPASLWSVVVASGQTEALHVDVHPSLESLPSITAVNLTIPAHDGLRLPLNLYSPKGGAEKKPVIVLLRRGASRSVAGTGEPASIGYDAWIRYYTAFGFTVVTPNVRGAQGFGEAFAHADDGEKRRAAIADVTSVGEWIKAQPWADAYRIALCGAGYGGYLALMAAAHDQGLWRAVIDLAAPLDWQAFGERLQDTQKSKFVAEFGDASVQRALSATSVASTISRPLFVLERANAATRPAVDTWVTTARRRGINVEYMLVPGDGADDAPEVLARTTLFLRTWMEIR